jgi:glutamate-ammonia-ligase adenylyltransferase
MDGVIAERGPSLGREDITAMRERIMEAHVRGEKGLDLKLSAGGLEDIEFHMQWLGLKGAAGKGGTVVQNTPAAIRRARNSGVLPERDAQALLDAYGYYRRLQTFLWLNGEGLLSEGTEIAGVAARFMRHRGGEAELFSTLSVHGERVRAIVNP